MHKAKRSSCVYKERALLPRDTHRLREAKEGSRLLTRCRTGSREKGQLGRRQLYPKNGRAETMYEAKPAEKGEEHGENRKEYRRWKNMGENADGNYSKRKRPLGH
jgi:hypothetical protein